MGGRELRNAGLGALWLGETDLPSINGPGRLLQEATDSQVTCRWWWGGGGVVVVVESRASRAQPLIHPKGN